MKIRRIAIKVVTLGVQSKDLQLITAMFSEDKVTEIFYLADEFCKFFDASKNYQCLKLQKTAKCNEPAIDVEFINDELLFLF